MNKDKDNQKQKIMELLGVSEEEALEILACDKAIDKGERTYFDLSPEEEKQAKKFANADTKKKTAKRVTHKTNEAKLEIIAAISAFLSENCELDIENLEIVNKERLIHFAFGENEYDLTLIQKRKAKN